MVGKSLDTLIHGQSSSGYLHEQVSLGKKIDLLLDVARGISYLHGLQPAIVHRDLKPSNILLDKNRSMCKVCDFGTATVNTNNTMTGNVGVSRDCFHF
jgi:serine/threonine protein kinase